VLYIKNLPVWERILRVVVGVVLVGLTLSGIVGTWGIAIISAAVVLLLTGFIGFCPACALAGRRLTKRNSP